MPQVERDYQIRKKADCAATGTKSGPAGSPLSGIGAVPPTPPVSQPRCPSIKSKKEKPGPPGLLYSPPETDMDQTTLLIILIVVLLIFGGGWYGRGRWF